MNFKTEKAAKALFQIQDTQERWAILLFFFVEALIDFQSFKIFFEKLV